MKVDEPELLEAWRTVLLVCLSAKGKVRGTHAGPCSGPRPRPAQSPFPRGRRWHADPTTQASDG